MKKYGKKYNEVKTNMPDSKQGLLDALIVCKENSTANFDESIDVVFSLGLDTKNAEENIRTTVSLPNGNGKTIKIAVFAGGEALTEAENAGADIVGGKELATKVASEEKMDVDLVISTPEMMAEVGQLGKILGPKGLMPNPKTGTVTPNVGKAVEDFKKGKVEIKNDKLGNVHLSVGKVSFTAEDLKTNLQEVIAVITRAKPASSKGEYIKSVHLSSTMGPSVSVDINL
ncbi:50S ribosomal protein L1 [Candidatus Actinomarina]|nr:50S ribosomal protein L1 [Candidatus Actinomarina sp.]|tara:strand:- start:684 stop:1370 length:687 start_codon:yes stop_codon:yes gene_type:complete